MDVNATQVNFAAGYFGTRHWSNDDRSSMDLYTAISSSSNGLAQSAVAFIHDVINTYGLENIALSFNGGKDCTVLLHLTRAVIASANLDISALTVIHFADGAGIDELETFLQNTIKLYGLRLTRLPTPYSRGLWELTAKRPIRAVLMGQRSTDPAAKTLTAIAPTDTPQYPQLDRINPLMNWTHADIWTFLRAFSLPYCSLYDRGYTSIGTALTSKPNSALWDESSGLYRPAWTLSDGAHERSGRTDSDNQQAASESTALP